MTKHSILTGVVTLVALWGHAQEKNVQLAKDAMSKNSFATAKGYIDAAMANAETKDKPKTLFVKSGVYLGLEENNEYKAGNPYREAARALFKLVEKKADYEPEIVNQYFVASAWYYYQDGARAFGEGKFADTRDCMQMVTNIYGLKRWDKLPTKTHLQFDTIAIAAYQYLIEVLLNKLRDKSKALTTISEARKTFPNDGGILKYELDYYIASGNMSELRKKVEAAVASQPNSALLQFYLATTYMNLASPAEGTKPANSAELTTKAEDAFKRALQLAPDNPTFNYNRGVLYFNQAAACNQRMNAVTDTSDAGRKRKDELKKQRDAFFTKGLPYFESAYNVYVRDEKKLNQDDVATFKNTMRALTDSYNQLGKFEKYNEVKKKLDSYEIQGESK